jgi:integral membrane protein (TIGR00529 family)
MADAAKLILVLGLMVALLRARLKVGWVMLLCSTALAALYLMRPPALWAAVMGTLRNDATLKLLLALSLIRMLELVLREREVLGEMMGAARSLFRSRRAVIVSMPMLIGMLPSVGGAYFSAPMVQEATRDLDMPPEEKAFVNYWFRHPWEFVLPLYPGILLAAALTGLPVRTLILANVTAALAMGAAGVVTSMRGVAQEKSVRSVSRKQLMSFLPIGAVLVLVMAAGLELWVSIGLVLAGLFVRYRYGAGDLRRAVRYGFSLDVMVLILGVMLFKEVMETSGAVANLSALFAREGIPIPAALLALPFVAGLLTGLTIGFVGATFPLLVSLPGGEAAGAVALAFAAGFTGVLLSPVHVCLVLTREYFAADMGGVYRRMLLPATLVILAGLGVFAALSP